MVLRHRRKLEENVYDYLREHCCTSSENGCETYNGGSCTNMGIIVKESIDGVFGVASYGHKLGTEESVTKYQFVIGFT